MIATNKDQNYNKMLPKLCLIIFGGERERSKVYCEIRELELIGNMGEGGVRDEPFLLLNSYPFQGSYRFISSSLQCFRH
jgi:hypothetical protein